MRKRQKKKNEKKYDELQTRIYWEVVEILKEIKEEERVEEERKRHVPNRSA